MDTTLIEALAEKVHDAWRAEILKQGFADHAFPTDPELITRTIEDAQSGPRYARACQQPGCYRAEHWHHADMVPYADLADHSKEHARVTVTAVLGAIDEAGYRLWPKTCVGKVAGVALRVTDSAEDAVP